jgi:phosphoribosylformylglycinamidine synthase
MKCLVHVDLRPDILDPQGKAVLHALHSLGYGEVSDVRVGKTIALSLEGNDRAQLEIRVKAMAEQLLANPIVENFRIEWPA